uniref:Uncharacterized protein n=1 Tax=Chromera velia CCMP2878 TaxID=1169474 RepID=A0A0G4I184_9ALVE|eukprot:Cvel_34.t1-p1 / transcript=Cvel_34.t1 / gene=Cvel_34 / organism=Chromera_velia_CCMP2878 / gene_product=hypothetical protein / transcript_product=hypothetical protein / location=Cvel_scaffold5:190612-194055(-) / protein_length=1003 / sequence_SO=supercontig / SO=protein_coding / is_pseudo=false
MAASTAEEAIKAPAAPADKGRGALSRSDVGDVAPSSALTRLQASTSSVPRRPPNHLPRSKSLETPRVSSLSHLTPLPLQPSAASGLNRSRTLVSPPGSMPAAVASGCASCGRRLSFSKPSLPLPPAGGAEPSPVCLSLIPTLPLPPPGGDPPPSSRDKERETPVQRDKEATSMSSRDMSPPPLAANRLASSFHEHLMPGWTSNTRAQMAALDQLDGVTTRPLTAVALSLSVSMSVDPSNNSAVSSTTNLLCRSCHAALQPLHRGISGSGGLPRSPRVPSERSKSPLRKVPLTPPSPPPLQPQAGSGIGEGLVAASSPSRIHCAGSGVSPPPVVGLPRGEEGVRERESGVPLQLPLPLTGGQRVVEGGAVSLEKRASDRGRPDPLSLSLSEVENPSSPSGRKEEEKGEVVEEQGEREKEGEGADASSNVRWRTSRSADSVASSDNTKKWGRKGGGGGGVSRGKASLIFSIFSSSSSPHPPTQTPTRGQNSQRHQRRNPSASSSVGQGEVSGGGMEEECSEVGSSHAVAPGMIALRRSNTAPSGTISDETGGGTVGEGRGFSFARRGLSRFLMRNNSMAPQQEGTEGWGGGGRAQGPKLTYRYPMSDEDLASAREEWEAWCKWTALIAPVPCPRYCRFSWLLPDAGVGIITGDTEPLPPVEEEPSEVGSADPFHSGGGGHGEEKSTQGGRRSQESPTSPVAVRKSVAVRGCCAPLFGKAEKGARSRIHYGAWGPRRGPLGSTPVRRGGRGPTQRRNRRLGSRSGSQERGGEWGSLSSLSLFGWRCCRPGGGSKYGAFPYPSRDQMRRSGSRTGSRLSAESPLAVRPPHPQSGSALLSRDTGHSSADGTFVAAVAGAAAAAVAIPGDPPNSGDSPSAGGGGAVPVARSMSPSASSGGGGETTPQFPAGGPPGGGSAWGGMERLRSTPSRGRRKEREKTQSSDERLQRIMMEVGAWREHWTVCTGEEARESHREREKDRGHSAPTSPESMPARRIRSQPPGGINGFV